MYKMFFCCLLVANLCVLQAQQTLADFENLDTTVEGFLNGSDMLGGFQSGQVFLPNSFGTSSYGDFWSGWSISSMTDTTTSGLGNQYSAITGSGVDGSMNYAVGYSYDGERISFNERTTVMGMYITNTTYVHNSLRDGDSFAKRFGGATGEDPDFLLLSIKAYSNGELSTESVDFYLADYRFDDNLQDYIVDTWEWVDLSSLGAADSLYFALTSTDIGNYGINTPTYFCVDNITTGSITNTQLVNITDLQIYPNPTTELLLIEHTHAEAVQLRLQHLDGRTLIQQLLPQGQIQISLAHLPKGMYCLELRTKEGTQTKRVIKQ